MRHRKTENTFALLGGAVLGAAAMYLLDPELGRKRREHLGEAAGDALSATGAAVGPTLASLTQHAKGMGQRLSEHASSLGAGLSERAADARDSARDAGSSAYESSRSALGGAYESARDTAGGWLESLGDWGRGIGRSASRRASDASDYASERAASLNRRYNPWHEEESHATAYTIAGIGAAALGAGMIYLLDPNNGRRRRAMAADTITGIVNDTGRFARQGGRYLNDLLNRSRGMAHQARRRFSGGERVPAETLLQRVRSEMGHVVSHANAIQVMADGDGVVTLSGRVLASEVDALLTAVNKIPGVTQLINRLDVQDTVEGVTEVSTTYTQRL